MTKSKLAVRLFLTLAFMACFQEYGFSYEYDSFGRRDPFVPLIGASETTAGGGVENILTVEDVIIQGILVGPDGHRNVIINGEIMKEGEKIGRLTVESIGDNEVTIAIDDSRHTLSLYD